MNLPKEGKVLTKCGMKAYRNPRMTRRNAPLVEVTFADGYSVKCTPDHLFLTVSGWKSARCLEKGSQIQSCSIPSLNTLTEVSIGYGRKKPILRRVEAFFTEIFGKWLSGIYRKDVIYTTKMATQGTIFSKIWNVFPQMNIFRRNGEKDLALGTIISTNSLESELRLGINPKKDVCGTRDMQSDPSHGSSGKEKFENAWNATQNLTPLSEKTGWGVKNTAQIIAKLSTIESVRHLSETADVWDITVPYVEHFCLENGAIVHNCADAMRMLGITYARTIQSSKTLEEIEWEDSKYSVRGLSGRESKKADPYRTD